MDSRAAAATEHQTNVNPSIDTKSEEDSGQEVNTAKQFKEKRSSLKKQPKK